MSREETLYRNEVASAMEAIQSMKGFSKILLFSSFIAFKRERMENNKIANDRNERFKFNFE